MLIKLFNSFSWFFLILLVTVKETEAKESPVYYDDITLKKWRIKTIYIRQTEDDQIRINLASKSQNITTGREEDDFNIKFLLTITNKCTQDDGGNVNIYTEEGSTLNISASGNYHINHYHCLVENKTVTKNAFTDNSNTGKKVVLPKITLKKNMTGLWICNFYIARDIQLTKTVTVENHTYFVQDCHFNVTFEDPKANETAPQPITGDPYQWIYIIVILFAVIILVQTSVIIYCKIKVKKAARIERISLRVRDSQSDEDEKRYSATPSRKNRISNLFGRNNQKDETCIYETLEEIRGAQPPTPPIETIPTLKRHPSDTRDTYIRKRPPIPLPKQVSDDDVTDSVRDIQRRTLKQNTTPETKSKPNKSLPPVPESPTKPEPRSKSPGVVKTLKNKPETKSKADKSLSPVPESPTKPEPRSKSPGVVKTLKNKPETKLQADKSLPPVPESPTKPEPRSKSPGIVKNLKNKPETKSKTDKSLPPVPESPTKPEPRSKSPGVVKTLKNKPGPSVVASELDNLFKKRQNGSLKSNLSPITTPGKVKRSLPDIKTRRMLDTEEKPSESQKKPTKLQPTRNAPQPPAKTVPPKSGPLKKKSLPPGQVPRPLPDVPGQVPRPLPDVPGQVPSPLPDVQESVYEEYDEEEPVYYNSDEEWTYEPLPQYNIYSA